MKITILGAGYVGIPTAAHFARVHEVNIYDPDSSKIKNIQAVINKKTNDFYIHEENLIELLQENGPSIFAHNNFEESIKDSEIIFIAVGTPPTSNGKANLKYICEVSKQIGKKLKQNVIIVNKSTVPPGTAYMIESIINKNLSKKNLNVVVGSCPEFLSEGNAIENLRIPDRIIFGFDDEKATNTIKEFFSFLHPRSTLVSMSVISSELTKYASNAILASRISYMNSLAILADKIGANIREIQEGVGKDKRIGSAFLHAGFGYGGSCFPKDTIAIAEYGRLNNIPLSLIESTISVNNEIETFFFNKIIKTYNDKIKGLNFALWGIGFKARTGDIRESKAVFVAQKLMKKGAHIHIFDPIKGSLESFIKEHERLQDYFTIHNTQYACFDDVPIHGLIIGNEYERFRNPKIDKLNLMYNKHIYDGKNVLANHLVKKLRNAGFHYHSVGRDFLDTKANKKELIDYLVNAYLED